jgi:hypothetical protein
MLAKNGANTISALTRAPTTSSAPDHRFQFPNPRFTPRALPQAAVEVRKQLHGETHQFPQHPRQRDKDGEGHEQQLGTVATVCSCIEVIT